MASAGAPESAELFGLHQRQLIVAMLRFGLAAVAIAHGGDGLHRRGKLDEVDPGFARFRHTVAGLPRFPADGAEQAKAAASKGGSGAGGNRAGVLPPVAMFFAGTTGLLFILLVALGLKLRKPNAA